MKRSLFILTLLLTLGLLFAAPAAADDELTVSDTIDESGNRVTVITDEYGNTFSIQGADVSQQEAIEIDLDTGDIIPPTPAPSAAPAPAGTQSTGGGAYSQSTGGGTAAQSTGVSGGGTGILTEDDAEAPAADGLPAEETPRPSLIETIAGSAAVEQIKEAITPEGADAPPVSDNTLVIILLAIALLLLVLIAAVVVLTVVLIRRGKGKAAAEDSGKAAAAASGEKDAQSQEP